MTAPIPNEYIVFEADQVLTNDHLNQLFDYLDQQGRWTRNKMIGVGNVCGFEVTVSATGISISRGAGITSQGYAVLQGDKSYTHYVPYIPIEMPKEKDFPFTNNNGSPYTKTDDLPFYNDVWKGRSLFRLISADDAQKDDLKPIAVSLSAPAIKLSDYAIVLFLEMQEKGLRNCDTEDCNDMGSKITFTVRPLLVLQNLVSVISKHALVNTDDIGLKRYNVTFTSLKSSDAVINAFKFITDDIIMNRLNAAYHKVTEIHNTIFSKADSSFVDLNKTLAMQLKIILGKRPVLIQYFYDFINDLIKAYDEFCDKAKNVYAECCLNENAFPLHLVLGTADKSTGSMQNDALRQYFIPVPVNCDQSTDKAELRMLYRRMKLMVVQFATWLRNHQSIKETGDITITPTKYKYFPLSDTAIPYYYDVQPKAEYIIHKVWNYRKAFYGRENYNLSYNAGRYASEPSVLEPLLYDIEKYNFFRIEGHIGRQYKTVLNDLVSKRQEYNLPFDVVAVSADMLNPKTGALPDCQMNDLEANYKLLISEFTCKVHNSFCVLTKTRLVQQESAAVDTKAAAADENLDLSIARLFAIKKYKKGDFMRTYCKPTAGTIGFTYLVIIAKYPDFENPLLETIRKIDKDLPSLKNAVNVYNYWVFEFIDAVESIMLLLMTKSLSELDVDKAKSVFLAQYKRYLTALAVISAELVGGTEAAVLANPAIANKDILAADVLISQFIADAKVLLSVCIDDRLVMLKMEYTARLANYRAQLNFFNYSKMHPGLEHKGGVPVGGTFILVYHEAQTAIQTATPVFAATAEVVKLASEASFNLSARGVSAEPATAQPEGHQLSMDKPAEEVGKATTGMVLEEDVVAIREKAVVKPDFLRTFESLAKDPVFTFSEDERKLLGTIFGKISSAKPAPPQYTIEDGAIIADFYVPYLCCSDCPPVAYILDDKVYSYTVTGGSVCFGVNGTHIGLSGSDIGVTYQLNKDAAPVGSPVPGTNNALDFGIQTEVGTYTVTGKKGSASVVMDGKATINPLPSQHTLTGETGKNIILDGSDTGINYQLFMSVETTTTAIGASLAGTGSALDFGLFADPGNYTVVATNATTGCTNQMKGTVVITVIHLPDIGGPVTVCMGAPVTFTDATPGGTWMSKNLAVATIDASTGLLTPVSPGSTELTYKVTGGNTKKTITVSALPTAFNVTGGGAFCSGGAGLHIGLSGSQAGVNYQLLKDAVNIGSVIAGTGSTLDFGLQATPGAYTVKATSVAGGCTSTMTGSVTITVNPLPAVFAVTGGGAFCIGGNGAPVGLSGSTSGINYQLLRGGTPVGSIVAGTGIALNFGSQTTPGTYTVSAGNPLTGCTAAMTGSAVVTANPQPTLFSVTGGGAFCSEGTGVLVGLSGSDAGVSYQLMNGAIPVGSAMAGTGSSLNFGSQTAAGTYTVVATNTSTTCRATMTGSATVTVNQPPIRFNMMGGGSFCSGPANFPGTSIGLDGSTPGIIYQLFIGTKNTGIVVEGKGTSIDFGLQAIAGVYTVVAINPATNCQSNMNGSAVIIVNQSPVLTAFDPNGSPVILTPGKALNLMVGRTIVFKGDIAGGTWSSTDVSIASVDQKGVVTAAKTIPKPVVTVVIRYTLPTKCSAEVTLSVNLG